MRKQITVAISEHDQYNDLVRQIQYEHGDFTFVGLSPTQVARLVFDAAANDQGYKTLTFTIDAQDPLIALKALEKHEPLRMHRQVHDLFEAAQSLLEAKAHDYSLDSDTHSNFRYASAVAEPFPAHYKPYAVLIGVKLARLSQLFSGKTPKNESIHDSIVDLINYCALLGERYLLDQQKESHHDP